jgi:hypothetical protein
MSAEHGWDTEGAPAPMVAGINWWLTDHPWDIVMLAQDKRDAVILAGLNDVEGVVWVDYEGKVSTLMGRFQLVHTEDDEEEA